VRDYYPSFNKQEETLVLEVQEGETLALEVEEVQEGETLALEVEEGETLGSGLTLSKTVRIKVRERVKYNPTGNDH
jgi:hypothetical protein